jgi:branched-chain amino acid transport system permease protein
MKNKIQDKFKAYYKKVKSSDCSRFKKTLLTILPSVVLIFGIWGIIQILILIGVVNNYYLGVMMTVIVFIVLATSLNIATGFLGQLILGHAAFMGIGAYSGALFAMYMQAYIANELLLYIISIAFAFTLTALVGFLIGTPALRLKGDYLGILTLGFGEIVRVAATNLISLTGGAGGLRGIPRIASFNMAYFTMIMIVLIIVLMMNSKYGRAMLSIREDEIASESVGINLYKFKILGFVLAAGFGGVGGALYVFTKGFIAPSSIAFLQSVNIFVIVVLGGIGSVTGSIISAIVLTLLPQLLLEFDSWRMLIYSTLLILMMLFRPQGLMGTKELSLKPFSDFLENKIHTKKLKKRGEQT